MKNRWLIVVEGTDFSGKSTFVKNLAKFFFDKTEYPVFTWKEPFTGSKLELNNVDLVLNEKDKLSKACEYLLRRRLLTKNILETTKSAGEGGFLKKDIPVVHFVDRGIITTLVHHAETERDAEYILNVQRAMCPSYKPDFIITLQPEKLTLAQNTVYRAAEGKVSKSDLLNIEENYARSNKYYDWTHWYHTKYNTKTMIVHDTNCVEQIAGTIKGEIKKYYEEKK